jgi:transposase-like protein
MANTKSKQDALIDELLKECQDPKDILAKKWTMPIRDWRSALNQFVILFGARVPM